MQGRAAGKWVWYWCGGQQAGGWARKAFAVEQFRTPAGVPVSCAINTAVWHCAVWTSRCHTGPDAFLSHRGSLQQWTESKCVSMQRRTQHSRADPPADGSRKASWADTTAHLNSTNANAGGRTGAFMSMDSTLPYCGPKDQSQREDP